MHIYVYQKSISYSEIDENATLQFSKHCGGPLASVLPIAQHLRSVPCCDRLTSTASTLVSSSSASLLIRGAGDTGVQQCLNHMTLAHLCEKNLSSTLASPWDRKCRVWVSFLEALWVCGYSKSKLKYFIVNLPCDEKNWNLVNILRLSKGSDCALFRIFPITFKGFRQFFRVRFLICPFSQERLDESYWNLTMSFA